MRILFRRIWLLLFLLSLSIPQIVSASALAQLQTGRVVSNANLRAGPGTNFAITGKASAGDTVTISRCNTPCTWYQLDTGAWIATFLVDQQTTPAAPNSGSSTTDTTPLTIVGWNVELNNADPQTIRSQMASFQDVDLWGIVEVNRSNVVPALEAGAEEGENADYGAILGQSGGGDRLLILYDADKFELIEQWEIDHINTTGNARAPLVAHLRNRSNDQQFLFMVNHLYRSRDAERHKQAQLLNQWAATQKLPIIAVGDYNFDWSIQNGANDHDAGYDLLVANSQFTWVQPQALITTQCSGWPCSYESVLDFVFTAGAARQWKAESEIIVRTGDFPDTNATSDHRPVLARFWPSAAATSSQPASIAVPVAAPLAAPLAALTTEPACPSVNRSANLRSGPGTNYAVAGSTTNGSCLTIVAQTPSGDWYKLANGSWVAAFLVDNGPSGLPTASAPAPPVAQPAAEQPAATQPVVEQPAIEPPPTATPEPAPQPEPAQNCDPSYPDMCLQPGIADLDCGEISWRRFRVLPPDPHRFDGDHDGIGCESN